MSLIRALARWSPFGGVVLAIVFVIIPNYPPKLNEEQEPIPDLVGITAASLGVVGVGFGISNFLVSEIDRKEKRHEKHREHITELFHHIGNTGIATLGKYQSYVESVSQDYFAENNTWTEGDVDNELKEHLKDGYKELYAEYFGNGGVKERIEAYNQDVSDLLSRINKAFNPRGYKVRLRLRRQVAGESTDKMTVADDAGHFKLQDDEGVIFSDADKRNVENFKILIEKESPSFLGELGNLEKRKEKLASDIKSFHQKLLKEWRHLRQYDDLHGHCKQCKNIASLKYRNPFRKEAKSSDGLSDNTIRREAVDIAFIVLISTFLISFGAIMLSVGVGFAFGALPTLIEKASSNLTSSDEPVLKAYAAVSGYSLALSYLGGALIIGGLGGGLFALATIWRRIPRHSQQL